MSVRFASVVGAMLVLLILLNDASAIPTSKNAVEDISGNGEHEVLRPAVWQPVVRFAVQQYVKHKVKELVKKTPAYKNAKKWLLNQVRKW
ncbi:unnamed protein product [Mesocestoides corti]|uniref:Secreted protein n=1 Tax=Mesocestoides corti TaxID=53468 RepID=A0A0R3U9I8_MESCO|nr:unnamed protein product [Mesocestoides corti]